MRAQWLGQLPETGVRYRAEVLYHELDVLRTLRPQVKRAEAMSRLASSGRQRLGRSHADRI